MSKWWFFGIGAVSSLLIWVLVLLALTISIGPVDDEQIVCGPEAPELEICHEPTGFGPEDVEP